MRNLFFSAALAVSTLLVGNVQAAEPVANQHYTVLSTPLPTSTQDQIEVVEVFWYGCPHCYQFEPSINEWASKLPKDVKFVRIPAQFNELWAAHARLFFALEVMKVEAQVHNAVFEGIHQAHDPRLTGGRDGRKMVLPTAESMGDFLAERGIDKAAFIKTFNSFAVSNRLKAAGKLVANSQLNGVPALIVNGKYRFDIGSAGGVPQTFEVADYLIAKERAAK
jgi:thiol:disulfide interchange protein DsbA